MTGGHLLTRRIKQTGKECVLSTRVYIYISLSTCKYMSVYACVCVCSCLAGCGCLCSWRLTKRRACFWALLKSPARNNTVVGLPSKHDCRCTFVTDVDYKNPPKLCIWTPIPSFASGSKETTKTEVHGKRSVHKPAGLRKPKD